MKKIRLRNSKKSIAWTILAIAMAIIISGCAPKDNVNSNTAGNENVNDNAIANQNTNTDAPSPTPTAQATPDATPSPTVQGEVKTFEISGQNFSFSLSEIRVKKGDKVKIIFKNVGGFHDWVIDEFNARVPQIQEGNTAEVEFTADKTGTFEYYCAVDEHRAKGMKGNLIVE